MRAILLILALFAIGAINFFAIKMGVEDSRPAVRIAAVASGGIAMICAIAIPGAFLRFLLSSDSLALTNFFTAATAIFTATSLMLDFTIAVRLWRNAA